MTTSIAIPETRQELQQLEKENNVVVKINSKGILSSVYPAYRKIARFVAYSEEWKVIFVAAKDYNTLNCSCLKSNISYDELMGKLATKYTDSFGRIAMIFTSEEQAIEYLLK